MSSTSPTALRRSALYTPGANPTVLRKALGSGADVLIFDLEDAVAPDQKTAAREHVRALIAEGATAGRTIVVRVNGLGSAWVEADVAAMAALPIAALLFPKVATVEDVDAAEALLARFDVSAGVGIWAMIETPRAILEAQALGRAATRPGSRMTTWILGTNDLIKEMRGRPSPDRAALMPSLAIALAAARAYGLTILDGVHNDFRDLDGHARECAQGRDLGFDGKTLIHPTQLPSCHAAYSPTAAEIDEARAILAAFDLPENRDVGVIKIGGRMVERLHAEIAQRTVAMADAIAAKA